MAIQFRSKTDDELRAEGIVPPKRSRSKAVAVIAPARHVESKEVKMTKAQAAANLPPAGRDAPVKITIRMSEEEGAHLDAIRGQFSRIDAIRLLLRAAERLGL